MISPEEAAVRGAALKSAHSFANQQSECPASLAQAFVPEYLFGTLRVKINGQLDKELATPTRKLPFHETSLLSDSTITVFPIAKYYLMQNSVLIPIIFCLIIK